METSCQSLSKLSQELENQPCRTNHEVGFNKMMSEHDTDREESGGRMHGFSSATCSVRYTKPTSF